MPALGQNKHEERPRGRCLLGLLLPGAHARGAVETLAGDGRPGRGREELGFHCGRQFHGLRLTRAGSGPDGAAVVRRLQGRPLCCFHLQPGRHPVGERSQAAGSGPHRRGAARVPRSFRRCTLQGARAQVSGQPGLGKEQELSVTLRLSDVEETVCSALAALSVAGGLLACCGESAWLSSPTPLLPTEPHRQAGEVNFQQPPEFLMTFLGVFVT